MFWLSEALDQIERGHAVVLVTVARTRGSAPRPAGTKLLVNAEISRGSVGGGGAERQAMRLARDLLAGGERRSHRALDPDPAADKCCGGAVELVFERLEAADREVLEECRRYLDDDGALLVTPVGDPLAPKQAYPLTAAPGELLAPLVDPATATLTELAGRGLCLVERLQDLRRPVWIFGAGHVGRALVRALEPLPFRLTWVDDRGELLPAAANDAVRPVHTANPALEVARIPAGAFVLVMTHSHGLDFEIAEAALRRGDLGLVGLIGSAAKKAQFLKRCNSLGLAEALLRRLVCPIGLPMIHGREPAVIAASVAAQLLQVADADTPDARRAARPLATAEPGVG